MSEKRFVFATNEKWFLFDNETEDYLDMEDCKDKLNEQQATISALKEENEQLRQHHQEYKTMLMNWDSLVEKASEISLRNIELVEKNARLQRENEQLKTVMENV